MSRHQLLIGDSKVYLVNGSTYQAIETPEQVPKGSVDIYLNLSECDVRHSTLPRLGYLDKWRFLKTKQLSRAPSILQGFKVSGSSLVEFTCPLSDYLNQWLQGLISNGVKIHSIYPLIIPPITSNQNKYTLVVSNHGGQDIRQTAFVGRLPLLTRLTHAQHASEEIRATLSYLKHQYGAEEIDLEAYTDTSDCLSNIKLDRPIKFNKPCTDLSPSPYLFRPPQFIQEQRAAHLLRYTNMCLATTSLLATAAIIWQTSIYQPLLSDLDNKQQQLALLDNQLRATQSSLPFEKLLPEPYKANLKEPSPIGTFMSISIAMVPEIILSNLKWERTATEEKILLEVKVLNQEDETDQKLDAVKEFAANLRDALPTFQVNTESLPHAAGDQETFTGSTSQEDLALAGDLSRGRLSLIRKINP